MSLENLDDDVIQTLEKMIENLRNNIYNDEIKNEILETNKPYVTGKRDPIDKEFLRDYIVGWWIFQNIGKDIGET